CLEQRLEDFRVARNDATIFQVVATTGKIADKTAGFGDQQHASRYVPLGQAKLKETIGATSSEPGKVKRGRTGTTQASGGLSEITEHAHVVVEVGHLLLTERKAGANQGFLQ